MLLRPWLVNISFVSQEAILCSLQKGSLVQSVVDSNVHFDQRNANELLEIVAKQINESTKDWS